MQASVEEDYFEVAEVAVWHELLRFYRGKNADEESLRYITRTHHACDNVAVNKSSQAPVLRHCVAVAVNAWFRKPAVVSNQFA